jgi:tripartite-type tricarboxylate transporter receptor subunit TctC
MKSANVAVFLSTGVVLACAGAAHAQYPSRPIRLIVPFAGGSVNDVLARVVAAPMSDALGQPIVIDNRAGAAGNLGAEIAANATPDGYTLFMGNAAHAISVSLYRHLNYNLVKDFAPVSHIAAGAFVLAANPSLPVKSVKELIALARSRPDALNVGVGGASIVLAAELFKSTAGVRMTNINYKGTPAILTAIASGEVSIGFPPTSAAVPLARAGKLRALAVTGKRRSKLMPEIPTIAEAALPGYEATTWYALMVPAGTPRKIVTQLNAEVVKALERPDVRKALAASDLEASSSTPRELGSYVASEIAKWGKVVKASGLHAD